VFFASVLYGRKRRRKRRPDNPILRGGNGLEEASGGATLR